MTPDAHTPCPACPKEVRDVYATGRKILAGSRSHFFAHERLAPPEYEELYQALEALRPFVDGHHANQLHAFSEELEAARHPTIVEAPPAEQQLMTIHRRRDGWLFVDQWGDEWRLQPTGERRGVPIIIEFFGAEESK